MRLAIFLLFFATPAFSMTVDGKGELNLSGEYREFPQTGLGPYTSAWEAIFKGNYQTRITNPFFRLEITPELRGFQSKVLRLPSTGVGYSTVKGPERLLSLAANIYEKNESQWVLDIERLNYVSFFGALELQLGRKPVGVGTLKVLPIWNKFSRPLPNTAGPNFIFGQDSAILRTQRGNYSFQAIDIEGKNAKEVDAVRWLEAILYDPNIEFHLMASRWWGNNSLGFALAKDLAGATIRGEALWIGFDKADGNREAQAGLGAEYAINESWTLLAEGIFYEMGASSSQKYAIAQNSRYRSLRAKAYSYLQATWQISSFWSLNASSMVNLVDGSFYPMLKLTNSLSDNWELSFDARAPLGSDGQEFSRKTFQYPKLPAGTSIGAPSQFSVQLSTSF